MLSRTSSKKLQKEQLLNLNIRVDDKDIEKVVSILFRFAEKKLFEEMESKQFSFKDIFDFEKSREVVMLFSSFYLINNSSYMLLSSKDTLSSRFFHGYKLEIKELIENYTISEDLTEKELKRLDKAFSTKIFNSNYLFFYRNLPANQDVLTFKLSAVEAFKELNLLTKSRFNSYTQLKTDNRSKLDMDIIFRAKEYLTPEYRYSFYENLVDKWNSFYEDRETIVMAINSFEEKTYNEEKITFV